MTPASSVNNDNINEMIMMSRAAMLTYVTEVIDTKVSGSDAAIGPTHHMLCLVDLEDKSLFSYQLCYYPTYEN